MLRAILAKLKGIRPDPTADWPQISALLPTIDRAEGAVGELRFGDDLAAARRFGRPEEFEWIQPNYCVLLYAKRGFQLDFDFGRFAYVAFFVGPDAHQPDSPLLTFSTPLVDSNVLSRTTSLPQVETVFGPADIKDRDDSETVLFYSRESITLEFEFGSDDMLKRINACPA